MRAELPSSEAPVVLFMTGWPSRKRPGLVRARRVLKFTRRRCFSSRARSAAQPWSARSPRPAAAVHPPARLPRRSARLTRRRRCSASSRWEGPMPAGGDGAALPVVGTRIQPSRRWCRRGCRPWRRRMTRRRLRVPSCVSWMTPTGHGGWVPAALACAKRTRSHGRSSAWGPFTARCPGQIRQRLSQQGETITPGGESKPKVGPSPLGQTATVPF